MENADSLGENTESQDNDQDIRAIDEAKEL